MPVMKASTAGDFVGGLQLLLCLNFSVLGSGLSVWLFCESAVATSVKKLVSSIFSEIPLHHSRFVISQVDVMVLDN